MIEPDEKLADGKALIRQALWAKALQTDTLPPFVTNRLRGAQERRLPWLSTMTPVELMLGRTHGMRPIATVSGTCWFRYGTGDPNSYLADEWGRLTLGWQSAIDRLKREAVAAGANAIVDVRLRSARVVAEGGKHDELEGTADCTVFGTAVRFDHLPPSRDPVVATISALEFMRLLGMGIVVCGIAFGTAHDFLFTPSGMTNTRPDGPTRASSIARQLRMGTGNAAVTELSSFWETIRRSAHGQLRDDGHRLGNGVLAKTHLGELIRVEDNYIGRHMVIGTVIDRGPGQFRRNPVDLVIDLRDDVSPLRHAVGDDGGAALGAGLLKIRRG